MNILNAVKRIIPNTLTCCNLISGCVATVYAFCGDARWALTWIIIGATFDFFDGMSARLLQVSSPIGKELDSLADDVTFGVAPAAILFAELCILEYPSALECLRDYLPYTAFIMAAFSALRLAKFNIDTRQTTSFIGVPTPANALFWGSLIASRAEWLECSPVMTLAVIALMLVTSWLLVCELPMFALKFKHWGWRGNEVRYSFVIVSAALIGLFGFMESFWMIILLYLALSIILWLRNGRATADPLAPKADAADTDHSQPQKTI